MCNQESDNLRNKKRGQIPKLAKSTFAFIVKEGVNLERKYDLNKDRSHMIRMHQ